MSFPIHTNPGSPVGSAEPSEASVDGSAGWPFEKRGEGRAEGPAAEEDPKSPGGGSTRSASIEWSSDASTEGEEQDGTATRRESAVRALALAVPIQ